MNRLLWSAYILRLDSSIDPWLLENPSECYLKNPEPGTEYVHYDWREQLKQIAEERQWVVDASNLKDVRSAFAFLTEKGFFVSMENHIILEECSEAFGLPAGSAIIAALDGTPLLALWEGEIPKHNVVYRRLVLGKQSLYHACLTCRIHKKGDCEGEPGRVTRNGCQLYQLNLMVDSAEK